MHSHFFCLYLSVAPRLMPKDPEAEMLGKEAAMPNTYKSAGRAERKYSGRLQLNQPPGKEGSKSRKAQTHLPNQACCSPWTSIASPKSASLTAAPLHLLASSKFSGWGEERKKGSKDKRLTSLLKPPTSVFMLLNSICWLSLVGMY